MTHVTTAELEQHLDHVRAAPADEGGVLRLLVRRPGPRQREVLTEGELDPDHGLVGDGWAARA